jgi:hypothetical protein
MNGLYRDIELNILLVYRSPSPPPSLLHLSVMPSLSAQHIPLNCNPAHCTSRFISHNFHYHSFTSTLLPRTTRWSQFPLSLCTLTVHGHEPGVQKVLHETLLWTFLQPPTYWNALTCIILFTLTLLRSPKQLFPQFLSWLQSSVHSIHTVII